MEKETIERSTALFKEHPTVNEFFVNGKGEFFTSRNLAENSTRNKAEIQSVKRPLETAKSGTTLTPEEAKAKAADALEKAKQDQAKKEAALSKATTDSAKTKTQQALDAANKKVEDAQKALDELSEDKE